MNSTKGRTYRQLLAEAEGFENAGFLNALRQKAYARFKELDFPTRDLDDWKYIDLAPILAATFAEPRKEPLSPRDAEKLKEFFLPEIDQHRFVSVNGIYSPTLSSVGPLPQGVLVEELRESLNAREDLLKNYFARTIARESNAFQAINTFSFKSGLFLYIPDKVVIDEPVHILLVAAGQEEESFVFYPRILIAAGASARLKVIVNQVSLGEARTNSNLVSEVYLGPNACVNYIQIERGNTRSTRFSTNRFYLKKHGDLDYFNFTEGGALTRNENEVFFEEEHGFCSLKGLAVLKGQSQVFNHCAAQHKAPHGISRQFYKSILSDSAKSEFNSLVNVYPGAVKSDSNQLNKTLLLSDSAQSYSRPQLKIHADDVSCTHGAAVGRVDQEEFFYLQSRGFSKEQARFMLTYGFAKEMMEDLEPAVVKNQLEKLVEEKIGKIIKSLSRSKN